MKEMDICALALVAFFIWCALVAGIVAVLG